uniref:Protein arginine methyltransferase NDUFAF7 n=1 Tax=Fagus sylvatica TaxID=28930 RepID=A0A2N9IDP8_FAGSY
MGLCLWILSQKMTMANRFKAFAVDLLRPTPASDDAVELEAPAQPAGRDDHVDLQKLQLNSWTLGIMLTQKLQLNQLGPRSTSSSSWTLKHQLKQCCRWAGLVDFVLGCGFCAVGLSGLRGGSWWVSVGGLARSGSGWVAGCFLVGLWGGSRSALGGSEMSVWSQIPNSSFVEHLEDNANHSSSPPSATVSIDLSGLYNPPVSELLNGRAFSSEQHLKGIIKFCGGPILIAEYMEEVLTNPKAGFYINRDVFGTEMVGVWAMCLWEQMGQPNKVNLVELGPGLGTLMADLLRLSSSFYCRMPPNLNASPGSLHIHMVECSPTLQKFQHSNLKCKDEDTNDKFNKRSVSTLARTPVTWHAALEQVPSGCMKLSSTSRHT